MLRLTYIISNFFQIVVFSGKNTAILFEHTADITYRGETNHDYLHSILHTAVHKEDTAIITKKSRLIAVFIQIFSVESA